MTSDSISSYGSDVGESFQDVAVTASRPGVDTVENAIAHGDAEQPWQALGLKHDEYVRIREILDRLLALSDAVVEVAFDPVRLRPADIEVLTGDASRFRAATGWRPEIPFERTLADTLAYWRAAVRA